MQVTVNICKRALFWLILAGDGSLEEQGGASGIGWEPSIHPHMHRSYLSDVAWGFLPSILHFVTCWFISVIRQSAWWTMDGGSWHCTGVRDQDHPQEKEMQKSKMAVWGGFTNSCEKKRSEKQRKKGRYTHLNAEFQRKIYPFECRAPKNSEER